MGEGEAQPQSIPAGNSYKWYQFDGSKNAQNLFLDSLAQAPIVMSFLALSIAILELAERDAGCDDLKDDEECEETVYGIKPSSVVTLSNGVMSILAAVFMPACGAICDYTPYRRQVGYWSAMFLVILNAIQVSIVSGAWEISVLAAMASPWLFSLHQLVHYAYYPSLTDSNHDQLVSYVARFDSGKYLANVLFLIIVFGVSAGFNMDAIGVATFGQILSLILSTPMFHYAWTNLTNVPNVAEKPEGEWYITAGFRKLRRTSKEVSAQNPPLKWFYITTLFGNPSMASIVLIGPTFYREHMNFSPSENIFATTIITLCAFPGAMLAKFLCQKKTVLWSMRFFLLSSIATAFFCAAVIDGPDKEAAAYIYSCIIGVVIGGYLTSETAFFPTLVPPDQEAELSGVYFFMIRVLLWLPPVMFTAANERSVSMNKAMLLVQTLSLIAFLISFKIGSAQYIQEKGNAYKSSRQLAAAKSSISTEQQASNLENDS
eukprot:CAMPEP_0196818148 /NCGR_PEP_ID=MMETSP1362-20130617/64222_1 /TAXON_ID=163516 /ORGANISM="Leptocylindrus danicus, Strain CCMP1856" /LENGTH=487 /DNA_ID=CAMNT_0042196117 /DNA_START=13 /DNA_END=1476 /DNA_ORIENTATION=-